MLTVHELKKLVYKLNGKQLSIQNYTISTKKGAMEFSINTNTETLIRAQQVGSTNQLIFYMQDEKDKSRMSYEKTAILYPDDRIIKIHETFAEHTAIAEVILVFMLLEEMMK